jgi:hypothetical protein
VLASLALAGGLFFQIHRGGGGTPGTRGVAGTRGDLVLKESGVAPRRIQWTPAFPGFGGIRRPPGGAELRHEHELLARKTAFGEASIWAAPSYSAPSRCTWLKVGRAVWGGMCRRYQPPGRGLLDVVPLRLPINGRIFNVLWGQVGTAVARLTVRFQNGREIRIPLSQRARPLPSQRNHVALQRVFLFPVPSSHWRVDPLFPLPSTQWGVDDRPALLIARNRTGRTVGRPLLFKYALLKLDRRPPFSRPVSGARFPPLLAERNAWPVSRPKDIRSRGTVLVAKRLIPKGTSWSSIAAQNLFVVITIPKGQIAPTAISDPAVLQGRVAAGDIYQNQQLETSDFTTAH